jgi:hypothetical protein
MSDKVQALLVSEPTKLTAWLDYDKAIKVGR